MVKLRAVEKAQMAKITKYPLDSSAKSTIAVITNELSMNAKLM